MATFASMSTARAARFRLGLRTALVLAAAATLMITSTSWVAYHLRWIRERHQILAKYDPERARGTSQDPRVWRRRGTDVFSRTLWLFSERPQRVIAVELDSPVGYLPDGLADGEREELDRIAQLFPRQPFSGQPIRIAPYADTSSRRPTEPTPIKPADRNAHGCGDAIFHVPLIVIKQLS